jgi:hypothetical protein
MVTHPRKSSEEVIADLVANKIIAYLEKRDVKI